MWEIFLYYTMYRAQVRASPQSSATGKMAPLHRAKKLKKNLAVSNFLLTFVVPK